MKALAYPLKQLFTWKDILITGLVSLLYLLVSSLLIGFRSEQLMLVILFNALYYISSATRKFIVGFSVFILYWIIFDYMKAFPNYLYNPVHIESLYNTEKAIFGIREGGLLLTPNEYWLRHTSTFLDVLAGIFYLCWIPVPLFFAGYLFYKDREKFFFFSWTFLITNLVGFVVYYSYPAAAPWYVQEYGFVLHSSTPGNTAGLARFDDYFGITVFKNLYAKSSNVFAAMPSLHSAYPLLVFYYGIRARLGWINVLFGIITAGIWFAAVYTSHHYILDVAAGIGCAIVGILISNPILKWYKRNRLNSREKSIRFR